MNNIKCRDCGWFDPDRDGWAHCPEKGYSVYGGKNACKFVELTGGTKQEATELTAALKGE